MKSILKIALRIIAALGGFLDIGDLVFNTQAGALFRYDLLWAVALGTIGIGVYAEMSGRVAAVTGRPVFDSIRMRLGFGMGLVALIASTFVNVLTVAAELGGLAIILTLLFDAAFSLFVVLAAIGLVIAVALLPFGGIERIFGYCGLLMLVFVATAIHQGPDWSAVAHGFIPSLSDSKLYLYFVVGVFAAALMPYEVHFYSSGAIEEGWTEENLKENRLNAIIGYGLGGVLACALVVVSGYLFHPLGVDPADLGTVALPAQGAYGETGLLLALGGMMFCVGGAAIDSSSSDGLRPFIPCSVPCFVCPLLGRSLPCCGRGKWEPSRRVFERRLPSPAPSRPCEQSGVDIRVRRACGGSILADELLRMGELLAIYPQRPPGRSDGGGRTSE